MVELLKDATIPKEEVLCPDCGSVIRCEEMDWNLCSYSFKDKVVSNLYIICPKCFCSVFRYEDRSRN